MSNHENDLLDFDPTDDDLLAAEVEDDEPTAVVEDDDFDFDSNYVDDRYEGSGVPAWSVWA